MRPPCTWSWLRIGCVALVGWSAAPLPVRAQDAGAVSVDEGATPVVAPASTPSGTGFFGRESERRRVIPAFWRTHPFDQKFPQLAYTRGLGLQASGWLGGIFLNSYDRLSFIAGIERAWAQANVGGVVLGAGYRAGLITGYDEQLASWADETPVLPFVGLDAWVQVGRVSFDAFYVYRAITLETSVAF
jgi:hypothetical protein